MLLIILFFLILADLFKSFRVIAAKDRLLQINFTIKNFPFSH